MIIQLAILNSGSTGYNRRMDFRELPNQWLPALFSRKLTKKPVEVELCGVSLVLFRDAQGKPVALRNQCIHRGASLAMGRVTDKGHLECPFHGWQFDSAGQCQFVPWNPDVSREHLCAQSYSVQEKGGIIWLFTGSPSHEKTSSSSETAVSGNAIPELVIPEVLTREGIALHYLEVLWQSHWTRAMENMLDVPHLAYVHKNTIGRFVPKPIEHTSMKLTLTLEDLPTGFRVHSVYGKDSPEQRQSSGWIEWHRPLGMILNLGENPVNRQHVFCVPVNDTQTRMMFVSAYGGNPILRHLQAALSPYPNTIIQNEDQRMIEPCRPIKVPQPAEEKSVATDKPTLRFRNWYFEQNLT